MALALPLPLLLLGLAAATADGLDNGLARRPPMGWLAWQRFTCQTDCARHPNDCIDANLFAQMAERLADDGWLALGYDHLHVDDCWSELARDAGSRLVADRRRFPAGIRALADQVHASDGLKLGLYGDCGTRTCAGYPGQLRFNDSQRTLRRPLERAHLLEALSLPGRPGSTSAAREQRAPPPRDAATLDQDYIIHQSTYFGLDAQTLADWHVDSLKFDGCHVDPIGAGPICSRMAPALAQTGRPILLICEWPFYMMYAHAEPDFGLAAASCNVWRYYDDIEDSWLSILNTIDYTIRHQSTMLKYHGPGHWFDPDQLVIGNFGLSVAQARAQMAIWAIWSAPLFMSNDLRSLSHEFREILQNEQLIRLDQDRLGVFGQMLDQSQDGLFQTFVKPIEPIKRGCPSFAIVVLNRNTLGNRQKVSLNLAKLLLGAPIGQAAENQAAVLAYERQQQTQAPEDSDDSLEQLFSSAGRGQGARAHADQDSGLIEVEGCLERLGQSAGGSSGADDSDSEQPSIKFELVDLFDEQPASSVALGQELELLVSPSGVRALKLVEE